MSTNQAITSFEDNFHLCYPHNSPFDKDGSFLVGKRSATHVALWRFDSSMKPLYRLCEFVREEQPEKLLWCDISPDCGLAVTVADNALWLLPKNEKDLPTKLYQATAEYRLHTIPAIRPDGTEIIVPLYGPNASFAALSVNPADGSSKVLFKKDWMCNHFHFCPGDPSWLGFSHEGPCLQVKDRVWGWHPEKAPEGKCVFDQMADDPEKALAAGHERWCFHDSSVMIVAYGEGSGVPRGIYEAFTDGRPQKLISEGDRDFHLDVSRDGKWIVVDTTGRHDSPGKGWEDAWPLSDILVIDRSSGERRFVAHSRLNKHPSHAHPIFTPDGKTILFNEADESGEFNRIWQAPNPFL